VAKMLQRAAQVQAEPELLSPLADLVPEPAGCAVPEPPAPFDKPVRHVDSLQHAFKAMHSALTRCQRNKVKQTLERLQGFRVCTGCSGSEIQHVVGDFVVKNILKKGSGSYRTLWSCDCDATRQRFISNVVFHRLKGDEKPCMFTQLEDLQQGHATCTAHGKDCLTISKVDRAPDMFVSSWSCKDWSRLKNAKQDPISLMKENSGPTAKTFYAILSYLNAARVWCLVGENLEDMAQPGSDLQHFIAQELYNIGYACSIFVLKGSEVTAPTSRSRGWIVALEFFRSGIDYQEAKSILAQLQTIIEKFKCEHDDSLSLESILLSPDSPYLREVLKSHQKNPVPAQREQTDWQERFIVELRKKGLTWSQLQTPARTAASPWWPFLTQRAQCTITYELHLNSALTSIETSQSPGRCHTRDDHVAGTVLPKGRIWLPMANRKESLMIHGFREQDLDSKLLAAAKISDAALHDIGGNMFAGQCFMAIFLGMLVLWPDFANVRRKIEAAEVVKEQEAQKNGDPTIDEIANLLLL